MSDVEQFEDVEQDKRDAAAELEYYDNTIRCRDDVIMALKDALEEKDMREALYEVFSKLELKICNSVGEAENLLGRLIMHKIARQIEYDAIRFVEQNRAEK